MAIDDFGDDTATAIISLLRTHGAERLRHARARTLLDHLVGTYAIVRRWGQPEWLQHAALIHSAYGTDAYQPRLLAPSARGAVAAVAGGSAERLAYLFCVVPRGPLLAGTHRWARGLPLRAGTGTRNGHDDGDGPADCDGPVDGDGGIDPATPTELDALVLLHMANLAEQAAAADGSPGRWLVRLVKLAELLEDAETVRPPAFSHDLGSFTDADEALARRAYRDAVARADDPQGRALQFALAAAACSVVAEPCVWMAYLAVLQGDAAACRSWAAQAERRLARLGTAWDKRLAFAEWEAVIAALERSADQGLPAAAQAVSHPRALLDALGRGDGGGDGGGAPRPARSEAAPDPAAGRRRFQHYIEALAGDGDGRPRAYPDLPSRPWHDPAQFSLVAYLESNFAVVREEILGLAAPGVGGSPFHRESERIGRAGEWDVAFLYERGRRHDDVCAACPVTTAGIEAHGAIRTTPGLIYVSRLRAGTHIAPHRGPTNLRVRCHLGIVVPGGDCAIRVGDETRQWREGRCLVLDDYFDHEAWNHTEYDRIVLIVDLWHPGLSATEVALLEGLYGYIYGYAGRLSRYWSTNAAAARRPGAN